MPGYVFEVDRSKKNNEFFARALRGGREVWRTSETYKRKVAAKKAVFGLVSGLAHGDWTVNDRTKEKK